MKTEPMKKRVTPTQKHTITTKTRKLNVGASEVIRRAVESDRKNDQEVLLNALADELERSVRKARHALKDALAETRRTLEHFSPRVSPRNGGQHNGRNRSHSG